MNTKKPLILISNDDGYHAKGINSLIDMLRDIADIIVCAPESARSGFATAFSATVPYASSCAATRWVCRCGRATAHRSTA